MKNILFIVFLSLISMTAYGQSRSDIKLGLGVSNLGTGDKLIGKIEGEITKNGTG